MRGVQPTRADSRQAGQPEAPPARGSRRWSRPVLGPAAFLRRYWLPASSLLFLLVGLLARVVPAMTAWSERIWLAGLVVTGTPVVLHTLRGMLRGRFAADIVAMLAILTALILGEPLPGLVVVLMQTGGEALERYAEGQASAAVRALEAQAPRIAHRIVGGNIQDVPVDRVAVGDTLLVRPGEMIPCDAVVVKGRSHVDASRLTGEPVPISAAPGVPLMSGSINGEEPITVRATAISRESQYARIVELVRSAQASKSPLQRLADRYAVWFTPLTLAVASLAYLLSGDVIRVLAVLVVATPCPLILATPVAIIGGINQAARRQIIVRHGTALEQLGKTRVAVFDKTGTLTIGMPQVSRVVPAPGFTVQEILALTGAVEQESSHLLARTLVDAAERAGVRFAPALHVKETPGRGVRGVVDGRQVAIGSRPYIVEDVGANAAALSALDQQTAGLRAYVAIDGRVAGVVEYADQLRPNLTAFFQEMDRLGFERTILLSGDHESNVEAVARSLGITEAHGELLPQDKVRVVKELVADGEKVLMVGDGINDAPALSSATVGVALAGHGGGILAEAADVVILVDELSRVADAVHISRRALRIALQSIWIGLGLSGGAMIFAALGFIPPTVGAFLQEGIDVGVILNALRASR